MDAFGADAQCVVRGAVALTLRVSRALGLAPLRVTRAHGGGWCARVAPSYVRYGYLICFLFNASCFSGVLIYSGENDSVYKYKYYQKVTWVLLMVQISSIVFMGVYTGRSRMEALIKSLNITQNVNSQYNHTRWLKSSEKKEKVLGIVTLFYFVFIIGQLLHSTVSQLMHGGAVHMVSLMLPAQSLLFGVVLLLEAQFALPALRVNCALKAINDSLRGLLFLVDFNTTQNFQFLTSGVVDLNIPTKSINIVVDTMSIEKRITEKVPQLKVNISERIRCLTFAFEEVQKAVDGLNESFGFVLIVIFVFYLLYMIFGPYFLIMIIVELKLGPVDILIVALDITLHATYLLLVVQPGHEIETEMRRLRECAGELCGRAPTRLGRLYTQLQLADLGYSLMGVAKLTRQLIPAIIATAVTLTVLILQFQWLQE